MRAFRADDKGQILIIFALAAAVIFTGLAASVDLSNAYAARQRLSQVATLACQYSTRGSIAQTATSNYSGANGFQTYINAVNAFATTSLASQHWQGTTPTGATATPTSFFTATPAVGGTGANAEPTNAAVEMNASVPTLFGRYLNITSIPVHTKINCHPLPTAQTPVNGMLLKEGFETTCSGYCFTQPVVGSSTFSAGATNTFPPSAAYVDYNGANWYIVGYCLEIDQVGTINSAVPEGTHSAELDCDNGHGTAGNSSISTSLYIPAGQYELRYNYRSRVDYPDYDPAYICGSTANDLAWADDAGGLSPNLQVYVKRTNQINVYLDANIAGTNGSAGSAPLHQTIDKSQYLAGSNLIDSCVYSPTWIERSVKIKVTTPQIYWLTFAADGTGDSFGGQIDNIRLCQETCTGSPQDNFPSTWLAANNYGVNKVLFEDSFESPIYAQDPGTSIPHNKSGNLVNSTGTSVWPSSVGWTTGYTQGWATGPVNEVVQVLSGAYAGSQYVSMTGWNGLSTGVTTINRSVSRPFLLDPGYYQVSYDYVSNVDFSAVGGNTTYCYAAPGAGNLFPASLPNMTGVVRFANSVSGDGTTDIVGVFMSNGQLVSTPNNSGATLGGTTSYTNPDATITTTPTVPLDNVNWTNYNPSVSNPVIDACGYAPSYTWVPRSVSVKITKPGLYWLTFSANGAVSGGDGNGGGIDDVKLTALGSPYMSNPPTSPLVAIPVPDPQPDTSYTPGTQPGFTIVADPFAPPGADQ